MEFLFVTGFAALLFRGDLSAGAQKDCSDSQNFPPSRQLHLVSVRYIYHALPYHATMYIKEFRFLMVANLATISQSMVLCKENCKSGRIGKKVKFISGNTISCLFVISISIRSKSLFVPPILQKIEIPIRGLLITILFMIQSNVWKKNFSLFISSVSLLELVILHTWH